MDFLAQLASDLAQKAADEVTAGVSRVMSRHRRGRLAAASLAAVMSLLWLAVGAVWVVAAACQAVGLITRVDKLLDLALFGGVMIIFGLWLAGVAVYGFAEGHWELARRVRWVVALSLPLVYGFSAFIAAAFIAQVLEVAKHSISGALGMALIGGAFVALLIRYWIKDFHRTVRRLRALPEAGRRTRSDDDPTTSVSATREN